MYKIQVPIVDSDMVRYGGRERVVAELRRMGAERVFLATGLYFTVPEERKTVMENLKINADYFKARGFEVAPRRLLTVPCQVPPIFREDWATKVLSPSA